MAPPAPTNNFQNFSANSFNTKELLKHIENLWNFKNKNTMTSGTCKKYENYNAPCLLCKSIQNLKLDLSCMYVVWWHV